MIRRDALSGTAIKTAELISEKARKSSKVQADEEELMPGAAGQISGRCASIRFGLPGLVAHQEVTW